MYILDDQDDGTFDDDDQQEQVDYDPSSLGASFNPPPSQEAWDLEAAELAAGVDTTLIQEDTGVDLELLEAPGGPFDGDCGDSEEDADLERLDISDFLEPDVGVSAGVLGAARGSSPADAGRNSDGVEDEGGDEDLEAPLDLASFLEAGAGGGGFDDDDSVVWYGDGSPEDAEPEDKAPAKGTKGGGRGSRQGGDGGGKSGSVSGGFEGLTADEVCHYFQNVFLCLASTICVRPGRASFQELL